MTTNLVLVDDHAVLRIGLRSLLEGEPDLAVTGEAANGAEALALVERLRPDVLLCDIMLPDLSGLEVARRVARQFPATRVIIFTLHSKEAYVSEAIKSGAAGYVLKDDDPAHLLDAIRAVARGDRYLSPALNQQAINAYFDRLATTEKDDFDLLTEREREVFALVAEGLTTQEIAEKLVLSPRTVEVHRTRFMQKLKLRNQTELVRLAIKKGIISE